MIVLKIALSSASITWIRFKGIISATISWAPRFSIWSDFQTSGENTKIFK